MISERKLASSFTSFWRQLLPMGDACVRQMNLERERFIRPLETKLSNEANRRAIVNEMGFLQFKKTVRNGIVHEARVRKGELCEIAQDVRRYVSRLADPTGRTLLDEVTGPELAESEQIAHRLRSFFSMQQKGGLIVSPEFQGCGMVQHCRGDALTSKTLYEIKSGERDFRLIDLRQVLVYCALNFLSKLYAFENICLVNPRLGVYYDSDIISLIRATSGKAPVEFFNEFIDFISTERVSW